MRLPDWTAEEARLQCGFGRQTVSVLPIGLPVSVSIGVAEHHDGETVEQLFSRVDKALYAAKNDGRNRVSRMPFDSSERRRSRDGAA